MVAPRMGEKVCLYVVPKAGHEVTLEQVIEHLKAKDVAKYKWPERLEVVESFPRAAIMKVRKVELREDILRKLAKDVGGAS